MADLGRNRRPIWTGLGGRFQPEWAAEFAGMRNRSDLRPDEVTKFKHMARHVLGLTDDQLAALVVRGDFEEVTVHE